MKIVLQWKVRWFEVANSSPFLLFNLGSK